MSEKSNLLSLYYPSPPPSGRATIFVLLPLVLLEENKIFWDFPQKCLLEIGDQDNKKSYIKLIDWPNVSDSVSD